MRQAIRGEKFRTLHKEITQDYMSKLGSTGGVTAESILRSQDMAGGNHKCWQSLHKELKQGFQGLGLNIGAILPNPHQTKKVCAVMNDAFEELGCHFETPKCDCGEGECSPETCDIKEKEDNTAVFMDVEAVITTIVNFYNLRAEEVGGKLKVCLKLDETVWAGDKKMERLTLTVMNRALQGKEECVLTERMWFSVQSETEIWPVGMFEVGKEDHKTLKQHLTASHLNKLIQRHNQGVPLHVMMEDGTVDTFQVEWHCAGDLKTLKCMNGCQTGAMATCTCLYCMAGREPLTVVAGKAQNRKTK